MKILGIGIVELCVLLLFVVPAVVAIVLVQQYAAERDAKNADKYLSRASKRDSDGRSLQVCSAPAPLVVVNPGAEIVPPTLHEARFFVCFSALKEWRTSVGFSILGVLSAGVLNVLCAVATVAIVVIVTALFPGLHGGEMFFSLVSLMVNMVPTVCCVAYATLVYPSYFTDLPLLESSRLISMFNLLFGGIVFGPLWNSCLTKSKEGATRKRGISFIVYAALMAAIAALQLIAIVYLVDVFVWVNVPHV